MILMKDAIQAFLDYWPIIVSALVVVATIINRRIPPERMHPWMSVFVDVVAVLPRRGQVGPMQLPVNLPLVPSFRKKCEHDEEPRPPLPPSTPVAILLIGSLVLGAASCACWTEAERNTERCVIARQIVDCTKQSVFDTVAKIIPGLLALISGGKIDFDGVLDFLIKGGFDNIGCVLAALEHDLLPAAQFSPGDEVAARAASYSNAFIERSRAWRNQHLAGYRFKLPKARGNAGAAGVVLYP